MHPFIPGQRWLSESQADLGLGQVIGVDERCVHIAFPATGETRLYALRNAPLARVELDPGERIRDRAGRVFTVRARESVGGLIAYHCEDLDGAECTLPEFDVDDHLHVNRPQQRLLAGRIDRDLWFTMRLESWLAGMRQAGSPVLGLVGPRIGPIPHQLYIAAEVAGRFAPRVLLADEVGLGKTIEAGLILHRLLLTGRASRILILVPEPLLHQWLVEMRRRFNLKFALFDRERLAAMDGGHAGDTGPTAGEAARADNRVPNARTIRDEANPFHTEQCVLCSLDLLTADPQAARDALAGDWDMLVVDEAHHLSWSPPEAEDGHNTSIESTARDDGHTEAAPPESLLPAGHVPHPFGPGGDPGYKLVEALAARTPGVLLLTATPEQFGRAGHFGRLRLLDPDRFEDYQTFLDEERRYAPVAELAARLLDGAPLDARDQALVADLAGDVQGWASVPGGRSREGRDNQGLTGAEVCERLVDRHGTGRVLFRNTRAAISGFPGRDHTAYPLPMPPDCAACIGTEGLTPEAAAGPGWTETDPRTDWLIATLRAQRPVKVLLIAARAQTVLDLREDLLRRAGIHAAVFHEGMEIVERDRAAAYFAAAEVGTQVLLCSEIGSEGRNFQFAHHLVLFDLPLDPDLLEQRIGRLDRIGQRHTVRIHIPYLSGGPGETLYRWYAEGLRALDGPCPAAPAVFARLAPELCAALADSGRADDLIAEARELTVRIDAELAAGRDRLLELHSHRPKVSATLVEAVERQDAERSVADWLGRFWDAFGVESEPGPGGALVIRPGPHMLHETFPELPEDGLKATFDRAAALAHEDRAFLTWEHPMVRGAMELLAGSDLGASAITLVRDPRFKPATLLLEAVYVAACPAPPALEVGRFLPPTALRLVMDGAGRDLAAVLSHEALRGDCLTRNRKLATAVVRSQAARLTTMLERSEVLAQTAAARLRDEAQDRMHAMLGEELDRLRSLAAVNPLVRAEEIAYLEDRQAQLACHLARTQARLDALRVIVTA